ncbi:MAG: threonine synthase [Clostridia bacterium]|nr:threonine synthase [Clostridia bacterium]
MKYVSTRSDHFVETSAEAILKGIAPDGGLYMPDDFSAMRISPRDILLDSAIRISSRVMDRVFPDFGKDEMDALIQRAYRNKFETADLTPVVGVGDAYVLELFRGPTSAFKDVALSVLPHLIVESRKRLGVSDKVVILTATSGDTGKAALEGFHDVDGTQIVVFYPDGGVSDVQRMQMVTQQGDNVKVCAIRGNFDDAQTGVKRIFASDQSEGWSAARGARLSSANSINIGRLAPQIAYYFKAYVDLVLTGQIVLGAPVHFVVPTGNFGDILAGEFARRMGLPIGKLICASNANNVLTDFIRTGKYDRRREFLKTISPSMDILISSNLERYLYLLAQRDAEQVRRWMNELSEQGWYQIPDALRKEMNERFLGYCASDDMAKQTIRTVWEKEGYLLDPHTAVAWNALEQYRAETDDDTCAVVLSTASPYKFSRDVLSALNMETPESGMACMDALYALTKQPIPRALADLRNQTPRFEQCIDRDEMLSFVQSAIEA